MERYAQRKRGTGLEERHAIEALLSRHAIHLSKSKGQNFLVRREISRQIAEAAELDLTKGVLEIGPGIGALSSELCARAGKVAAVELDAALLPVLSETMAAFDNFTVIHTDAMKLDLAAFAQTHFSNLTPCVCANLPYNIATPLLTRLAEARCYERMTVLIQKEVAQRICARPGTGEYGAFSVHMQYYTVPELCFEVPPDCFLPAPKVTSAVLRATTRGGPPVHVPDEAFFFRVVRAAFALRRKTLVNSLSTSFGALGKEKLTSLVTSCGLAADVRGERLDIEAFARLAEALAGEMGT